ncbi:MAG: translation initiation factor IF-2 [Bacteroidia bacterium]
MTDKKEYRLFKVAKELNVSSGTLVEYLHKHGQKEVSDNLNTKVSQIQYDLLLKQFGSDKTQKEKVEMYREHRKDEQRTPKNLNEGKSEEAEELLSANQLRNEIDKKPEKLELFQKVKVIGKIDLENKNKKVVSEEEVKTEINTPPVVPTPPPVEPPVKEVPVIEENETPKVVTPPLKPIIRPVIENVVIEPPVFEEAKVVKPVDEVKPVEVVKPLEKVEMEIQERPKEENQPVREPYNRHKRNLELQKQQEREKTKTPTLKPEQKTQAPVLPKVENKEKAKFVNTKEEPVEVDTNNESDDAADSEVIRPSVERLPGLKVLGKINIVSEDTRKKKDKDKRRGGDLKKEGGKELIKDKDAKEVEGDEAKRKRKRKRKRKKTPGQEGAVVEGQGQGQNQNQKPRTEKPAADRDKLVERGTTPRSYERTSTINNRNNNTTANKDRNSGGTGNNTNNNNNRNQGANNNNRGTGNNTNNNNNRSGNNNTSNNRRDKKEKITDKQVQSSIRTTLSEMGKGASRSRQKQRRQKRDDVANKLQQQREHDLEQDKILRITEFITANEFANLIDVPVTEIIKKCFMLGMMVSINQRLDADVISIIADEYDLTIEFIDVTEEELEEEDDVDTDEDLVTRNPVITVMGHVDHGKTTLLDYLRKANVAAGEAGGITQHIGAYEVKLISGNKVTFLDTPGHEAFTAMRARGTKVTDVAIIVIAADDAVMPTTREAIAHAQSANVPMVFAINKIDKPGADVTRIKTQLAEMNLLVQDWGGKYQCQEIAAKFGTNVDDLLETVILESEILDLKANPKRHANGSVIESRVDKGRGNVVTMLVQNGTLKVGDVMVAGIHFGKVRALINQKGERITEAGPSTPVQVLGLSGLPQAGDKFQVYEEDSRAKEIAQKRQELYREQQFRQTKRVDLIEIARRRALGNFRELNLMVKGDVDGSVEALSGALLKLGSEEVAVNLVLKGTGAISESDVNLAAASDAVLIAFNVRPTPKAKVLAEKEGVSIRTYSIIYDAINDVKDALEGLLSPEVKEEMIATIDVRNVFKITKVGIVAGCYITSGKAHRSDLVRVIREGVVVADTSIETLKRFKEDVKEVSMGYECGIMLKGFTDIQEGDLLETYRTREIKRKLD